MRLALKQVAATSTLIAFGSTTGVLSTSTKLAWSDSGQTLTLGGTSGTTSIVYGPSVTAAITQTAPSSDVAVFDFTVATQAPFASATVNKSSGNLILSTSAALAGGTIGAVKIAPGGTVSLSHIGTASTITSQYASGLTVSINQIAPTTDVAPTALTITAQGPLASASTNKSSANLVLATAAPVAGGVEGQVQLAPGGNIQGQFAQKSTDYLTFGGPNSGTGQVSTATAYIKLPSAAATIMSIRNAANTANAGILTIDGANNLTVGDQTNLNTALSGFSVSLNTNGGTDIVSWAGSVFQFSQASTIRAIATSVAVALSVFSGASNTSGNNGAALNLGGGAAGGGAGLRGATNIGVGSATSGILIGANEVVQNNRVVSLCQGAALTSTQMPTNTGDLVIFIANASTNPSASAVGGGILYANAGALTWRGSSGTITVLGPA